MIEIRLDLSELFRRSHPSFFTALVNRIHARGMHMVDEADWTRTNTPIERKVFLCTKVGADILLALAREMNVPRV
jgi:hypothetical protein